MNIEDVVNHPLCIISTADKLTNATFIQSKMVPYEVYNCKEDPENPEPLMVTEGIFSQLAARPGVPIYSAAIVTHETPDGRHRQRRIAKTMVAAALACGHPDELFIGGQNFEFIFEAVRVCIVSEIPVCVTEQFAARVAFELKNLPEDLAGDNLYKVKNEFSDAIQANKAIAACITHVIQAPELIPPSWMIKPAQVKTVSPATPQRNFFLAGDSSTANIPNYGTPLHSVGSLLNFMRSPCTASTISPYVTGSPLKSNESSTSTRMLFSPSPGKF